MKIFGTGMDCKTAVVGFLLVVIFHVGSSNGESGGHHCVSFTCSDFSSQTLVIRKEMAGDVYCMVTEDAEIGEDVSCVSRATATLLSPSRLLLRSPERFRSGLLLEYGRDHERGKICLPEEDVCPTPPPSMTSNDILKVRSAIKGAVGLVALLGGVIWAVSHCVGKRLYSPVAKGPPAPAIEV